MGPGGAIFIVIAGMAIGTFMGILILPFLFKLFRYCFIKREIQSRDFGESSDHSATGKTAVTARRPANAKQSFLASSTVLSVTAISAGLGLTCLDSVLGLWTYPNHFSLRASVFAIGCPFVAMLILAGSSGNQRKNVVLFSSLIWLMIGVFMFCYFFLLLYNPQSWPIQFGMSMVVSGVINWTLVLLAPAIAFAKKRM
ncbi:MAG: hypothetical protein Q8M16_01870 [Pirellulaceae bacterium]|nr:hypothetical protein [Pirellulaceae bacterium]